MTATSGQAYSSNLSQHLLDCGKRASDIVNTYIAGMPWDEIKDKFIAIRLADGGSDGVIYDTKQDAVKHQYHEMQCAYVCFRNLMSGANPRDMAIFIKFNRDAYLRGFRLADPDDKTGGKEVLMTTGQRDFYRGRLGI